MKKIKFTCNHCQAKLRVPTHLAGVSAPCPKCGSTITAPTDLENVVEDTPAKPASAQVASPALASAAKVSASVSAGSRVSGRVVAEPKQSPLPAPVPPAPEPPAAEELPPAPPAVTMPPTPPVAPEPEARYDEVAPEPSAPIEEPVIQETSLEIPQSEPSAPPEPEVAIVEETILIPPPAPEMPAEPEVQENFLSAPEAPSIEAPTVSETTIDPTPESETIVGGTELEGPQAEAPRAVEKTQPIQINPRPSSLPPVRDEEGEIAGELPRLDVNLAESVEAGGGNLSPSVSGEGPTRVQLPQPGTEAHQFSPSDFIVPSSTAGGEMLDELPEPEAEKETTEGLQTSLHEMQIPEAAMDSEPEGPGLSPLEESLDQPNEIETTEPFDPQTLLRDEEDALPTPQPVPIQVAVPPPTPEESQKIQEEAQASFEAPLESETNAEQVYEEATDPTAPVTPMGAEAMPTEAEEHHDPLSEGSFENLLSRQIEPDPAAHVSQEQVPAANGGLPFEPAPVSTGVAAAPAEQLSIEVPPAMEPGTDIVERRAGETDVLDDIFGTTKGEKSAPSKSTVFLLSILGAVAIIAIVLVIFIGKSLGGFSVPSPVETADIPPPPSMREDSATPGGALNNEEPSLDDAPPVIDPVAETPLEDQMGGQERSTTTLPGDTSQPVRIIDSSGGRNVEGLSATEAARAIPKPPVEPQETPAARDTAAMSFDERIQQIVNGEQPGTGISGDSLNAAKGTAMNSVDGAISDFSNSLSGGDSPSTAAADLVEGLAENLDEGIAGAGAAAVAAADEVAKTAKAANYNPPASFAAPANMDNSPLGKTHDLLDAFLRAPDWETRIKYTFQGESLRPAIEEYYKKWPMTTYDRFSLQLFSFEKDEELGGPYWVYQVSTSDLDQGFPVIVRVEDGKLKVDWEIFSEFQDQHFIEFQKGAIASPHTFRVVIERVSDYYGTDRDGFENLDDYYVYQVSPPYGDLNEFSDYAFVKSDSELAKSLDKVVGLNDEPLAVIITLEQKSFPHGVKHLSVTEYITEGWFR